ncbi:hypothetical protein RhiirC2_721948 [Rhizophagus irregularis]|uniref:Uncharacterized protein n=1 Tax=Rhizophagus irregularis TaxID=588596 RepID=A0A2N1M3U1_9GLOM|nr:hypothetical protein RhiirC2_721948 [Rhizophagus irregularis]
MASEPLGITISNEPLTSTSEIQTDTSEPFQLEIMNKITVTEVKEAEEEKKNKQGSQRSQKEKFSEAGRSDNYDKFICADFIKNFSLMCVNRVANLRRNLDQLTNRITGEITSKFKIFSEDFYLDKWSLPAAYFLCFEKLYYSIKLALAC